MKTNLPDAVWKQLPTHLFEACTWLSGKMNAHTQQYGLTNRQYAVLHTLHRQSNSRDGLRIREIKRCMKGKADISRMVERLSQKGWIEKTNCPYDKRYTRVRLATEGLELLRTIEADKKNIRTFFKQLTEEEMADLNRLLKKMME
jgi:DNA-binding MarR family transcriptional regulator